MNTIFAALLNGVFLERIAVDRVMVWLGMRAARRRALNAATRYALWWAALAVATTLPLAFLPRHSTRWMQTNSSAAPFPPPDTGRRGTMERVAPEPIAAANMAFAHRRAASRAPAVVPDRDPRRQMAQNGCFIDMGMGGCQSATCSSGSS